jgi:hypothetical protein
MPNNARHYSKPRQRENKTKQNKTNTPTKQNYTTSTKPKTHKSFASCSPAESNFTTTKEEPTTPKLLQQKGLKTQEKKTRNQKKISAPKLITKKKTPNK